MGRRFETQKAEVMGAGRGREEAPSGHKHGQLPLRC